MKTDEAPKKIYVHRTIHLGLLEATEINITCSDIEYIRNDAFIEKARKWFEQQPETYDANGVRCYGMEDFEDFKKYMKGE